MKVIAATVIQRSVGWPPAIVFMRDGPRRRTKLHPTRSRRPGALANGPRAHLSDTQIGCSPKNLSPSGQVVLPVSSQEHGHARSLFYRGAECEKTRPLWTIW